MANSARVIPHRRAFQQSLHAWYRVHQRKLPWRDRPSLYKTVVSEFMLQQTQVTTVLPYFERWLRELTDFAALAAAPEAKVMKLWEGLGYYSRARNLHRLAQAVVQMPAPPRTPDRWRELPGVGPYTAAAITSIAFGEPAACVDGNIVRVLARLTGEARTFRDGPAAAKYFAPLATALVSVPEPGLHNQAMMELGATVCVRPKPRCPTCPVKRFCAARKGGAPEKLPRFKPKSIERVAVSRVWCESRGRLLLHRSHAGARRLAGIYELPAGTDVGMKSLPGDAPILVKRRTITRFQITEAIHRIEPTKAFLAKITANKSLEWLPVTKLDSLTLSGPHRRWIEALLKKTPAASRPGA